MKTFLEGVCRLRCSTPRERRWPSRPVPCRSGKPAACLRYVELPGQHQLRLLLGASHRHHPLQRPPGDAHSLHGHQHGESPLPALQHPSCSLRGNKATLLAVWGACCCGWEPIVLCLVWGRASAQDNIFALFILFFNVQGCLSQIRFTQPGWYTLRSKHKRTPIVRVCPLCPSFSPVLSFLWTLSADLRRWAGPDALHWETVSGTEAVPSGTDTWRARNGLVKPQRLKAPFWWWRAKANEGWPRLCNKWASFWKGVWSWFCGCL